MLDALKTHYSHLDTYIQRSTQYIRPSPIRRLPAEVLGIIFASSCTSFQRREYKTPLSLSLVCSKWRDIALSTPLLWTHIYIAPYSGGLDVYTYFLERCGNIPISVKIEIPHKDRPSDLYCDEYFPYEETHEYHVELVLAAYRNSAQWKVAELCMNQADVNLLNSPLRTSEFPLLESITLVNDGPAVVLKSGLFSQASLLTSFTVLDFTEDDLVDFGCYDDTNCARFALRGTSSV
ncbi:hypothetical protein CPB85DRAFT_829108 [Mucidula mucida]|nr:hypothetical protein CPB85DRAFT_549911 [Mucidula mucida]KAF8907564.1 hypothetical protein CPB85DRAFT_829108 [Mucidula mucida]